MLHKVATSWHRTKCPGQVTRSVCYRTYTDSLSKFHKTLFQRNILNGFHISLIAAVQSGYTCNTLKFSVHVLDLKIMVFRNVTPRNVPTLRRKLLRRSRKHVRLKRRCPSCELHAVRSHTSSILTVDKFYSQKSPRTHELDFNQLCIHTSNLARLPFETRTCTQRVTQHQC